MSSSVSLRITLCFLLIYHVSFCGGCSVSLSSRTSLQHYGLKVQGNEKEATDKRLHCCSDVLVWLQLAAPLSRTAALFPANKTQCIQWYSHSMARECSKTQ